MTWNVQALFDGNETGNEYGEYRASAGWTAEKYSGRLTALSEAISGMDLKPDIIAIEEIESSKVLEDLAKRLPLAYSRDPGAEAGDGLPLRVFFANNRGASLGIGIISRFPLLKTTVHSIYSGGEITPRPLLEVRIAPRGSEMVLFICHWKSKLGGAATEALRRASANVILRRFREISRESPGTPVVIMGDLNENYDEFYRQGAKEISALMPDDPGAVKRAGATAGDAEKFQRDYLVISRNKPPLPLYFPQNTAVFFSPWDTDLQNGSYYYGNDWETIDHFLLSPEFFDSSGWDFDSCAAADAAPFTGKSGYPSAYNPKTGNGLSDHLPLLLTLRLAD
jgi:endonuclease/exonuclease/phosphatase family metal-dependent hydrolase